MFKTTIRKSALLIVVLAVLTAGCFQIRNFRLDVDAASTGDRVTVTFDLYPAGTGTGYVAGAGYPFLLIGFDSTLKVKAVSTFDRQANFGGPFARSNNNTLRSLLLSGGECDSNGIDASAVTGMSWWAYHTDSTVDSTSGALGDNFRVKVAFERIAGADDAAGQFVVFSGTWTEVGVDGVPTSGEVACTSMTFSGIPFQP